MIEDLHGKVAFLTGAAEGLGNPIAREYIKAGMKLAMIDIQAEKLNKLADELRAQGGDVLPIVADLSNAHSTQAAVDQALDHRAPGQAEVRDQPLQREKLGASHRQVQTPLARNGVFLTRKPSDDRRRIGRSPGGRLRP